MAGIFDDAAMAAGLSFDPAAIELLIEEKRAQRRAEEADALETKRLIAEARIRRDSDLRQRSTAIEVQGLETKGRIEADAAAAHVRGVQDRKLAEEEHTRRQPEIEQKLRESEANIAASNAQIRASDAQIAAANEEIRAKKREAAREAGEAIARLNASFGKVSTANGMQNVFAEFDPLSDKGMMFPPDLAIGTPDERRKKMSSFFSDLANARTNAQFEALGAAFGTAGKTVDPAEMGRAYGDAFGLIMASVDPEYIELAKTFRLIDKDPVAEAAAKVAAGQELSPEEFTALSTVTQSSIVRHARSGKVLDTAEQRINGALWKSADTPAKLEAVKAGLQQASLEISALFGLDEDGEEALYQRMLEGIQRAADPTTAGELVEDILIGSNPDPSDAELMRQMQARRKEIIGLEKVLKMKGIKPVEAAQAQARIQEIKEQIKTVPRVSGGRPPIGRGGVMDPQMIERELAALEAKPKLTPAEITRRNKLRQAVKNGNAR